MNMEKQDLNLFSMQISGFWNCSPPSIAANTVGAYLKMSGHRYEPAVP